MENATVPLDVLTIDCRFCIVKTPGDVETEATTAGAALLAEAGGVGVAPREMVMGEAPRLKVKAGVEACVRAIDIIDTGICCRAMEMGCEAGCCCCCCCCC